MPLIRCSNGHFYDDEQHASCPWCAQGSAATVKSPEIEPQRNAAPPPNVIVPPPSAPETPQPAPLRPVRGADKTPEAASGFTKTETLFTGRVKSIYDIIVPPDEPEEKSAAMDEPVSPRVTTPLAITSGVFFLILAALPWFGATDYHSYIYCSMYALCAGLCALSFRYSYVNAAAAAYVIAYMSFCFFASFTNFDYYPFIMALSILPLLGKRRTYRVTVAALAVVCAFICSFLVARAMYEIKLGGKYTFVAGSLAVPLLMIWASPAGPLMSQRDENPTAETCGVAILLAMQFFPVLTFILAALGSLIRGVPIESSGALFHIADAGYVGISLGRFPWWTKFRFLAQIIQIISFSSFFVLALAKLTPRAFRVFRGENAAKLSFVT
ncbi:MAG: hypothetical protein LBO21_05560, partial [Synergistaceae bacterium]|nr:hypothetical protein [Synergistaceae bacterium]